ncbi:MAG TPA: phage holin family protein [Actinomycetota bacterium]|nr:phage holin family protein [Actinomycetota bacterium]
MATAGSENGGRRGAPFSELVRSLFGDVALLARREADLAKIELEGKASKVGVAAGLLAGGAVVALYAIATFVAAAVVALAIVLPAWAAALIVGAVLLVVAATLVVIGRKRLRAIGSLAPTTTIESMREDVRWIQSRTAQLKTRE